MLPLGLVSSEKGDFIVDTESFHLIKEHMEHKNTDVVIDYEHQTLAGTQAPASGWISGIALKSDGIYAQVDWTERAKAYLLNREYRYLSPVVSVRKEDRKVTRLHSVALTNAPAINGMAPIVNSDKPVEAGEDDPVMEYILEMLNLTRDDLEKCGRRGE